MTFAIYTLGCKVNYYESEAIGEKLKAGGLSEVDFSERADIYIINTCAVTAESERKAGQMIRRARRSAPSSYIIVTGCSAQISPERIKSAGADFVCGNKEKLKAAKAALDYAKSRERASSVISEPLDGAGFEKMSITRSDRTRAYIKIGDGCDGRCAYCVIRKARGPVRSKPVDRVISEAAALVRSGYREIVLTAIELSAYGKDLPGVSLADLILRLNGIEGLERIRLGSLDPATLTPAFIDRIRQADKLAPHFHLSLQSGCDRTLAAMRRKYNTKMASDSVKLLRQTFPDAMFTADVIVGFPGESDEDFKESAEFISSLDLLFIHIFSYSRREGTEAANMPDQIPEETKKRRSRELAQIRAQSAGRCMGKYIGRVMPVIFEEYKDSVAIGHTANFIEVHAPSKNDLHNRRVLVRLEKNGKYEMSGSIVDDLS